MRARCLCLFSFLILSNCQESKPQVRKPRTGVATSSNVVTATKMTTDDTEGSKVDDANAAAGTVASVEEDGEETLHPTPKGKPCESLTALENGTWPEGMTSAEDQSSVTGTCNEGYDGNPTITCTAGTWGTPQNPCTEKLCVNLDQAKSQSNVIASFASQTSKIGESVTGSCGSGFSGTPVAKCENSGSWTFTGGCTPTGQAPCTNLKTTVEIPHGVWPADKDTAD